MGWAGDGDEDEDEVAACCEDEGLFCEDDDADREGR